MSEDSGMCVVDYSYGVFSEPISKGARHHLTWICLKGIEKEYRDTPLSEKSRGRGRPPSLYKLLAGKLSVSIKSVRRWADPEAIHSNDLNAGKLAETAYSYDPEKTAQVLRDDVERHRCNIESWLAQVEANLGTHPYPEIHLNKPSKALQAVSHGEEEV